MIDAMSRTIQEQYSVFSASDGAGQKAIKGFLIGLIVPITTFPLGMAFGISALIAVIAYAFGLDGLDYGTSIMSETAGPMVEITARLLLPIYLALVLFFCHCWDYNTSRILDYTRIVIHGLLRSAHFRVLLPTRANCSLATSALHLPTLICDSRPERERPQFIAGDDPPLIYN